MLGSLTRNVLFHCRPSLDAEVLSLFKQSWFVLWAIASTVSSRSKSLRFDVTNEDPCSKETSIRQRSVLAVPKSKINLRAKKLLRVKNQVEEDVIVVEVFPLGAP